MTSFRGRYGGRHIYPHDIYYSCTLDGTLSPFSLPSLGKTQSNNIAEPSELSVSFLQIGKPRFTTLDPEGRAKLLQRWNRPRSLKSREGSLAAEKERSAGGQCPEPHTEGTCRPLGPQAFVQTLPFCLRSHPITVVHLFSLANHHRQRACRPDNQWAAPASLANHTRAWPFRDSDDTGGRGAIYKGRE